MFPLQNVAENIMENNDVYYHLYAATRKVLSETKRPSMRKSDLARSVMEQFLVELGIAMMDRVDGPHFTTIDPRCHFSPESVTDSAIRLAERFEANGVPRHRVVVSIPATDAGIHATRTLVKDHSIFVNLDSVTGLSHAAACAEAGATTITIPIKQSLTYFNDKNKGAFEDLEMNPGIENIQAIIQYFKLHNIATRVIAVNPRKLTDLEPLGSVSAVALNKAQMDEAAWMDMPFYAPAESSAALFRARQAAYPMAFLQDGLPSSLLPSMSAASRAAFQGIVNEGTSRQNCNDMTFLMDKVNKEIRAQIKLEELDIQTLNFRPNLKATPKKATPPREPTGGVDKENKGKPVATLVHTIATLLKESPSSPEAEGARKSLRKVRPTRNRLAPLHKAAAEDEVF
ncbi:hypothetical protein PLICRDRAFT_523228 [Plicaturopsis crispa FD-325 SS-3]|nr:hypothetical protein PLICRDRAFT_523228 [Plicaturopsis crispa FD-325 SS-3]